MTLDEILETAPENLTVVDAFSKCSAVLERHDKVFVSVSGGSDSDVMMDLIIRCGGKDKASFGFFNTGLEYEATKRQIEYLEKRYGVEIQVIPPVKPIPTCVKEYGVPFWSKHVSEMISRLQRHGFQWEDEPFDVLIERYPNCKSALQWWCNAHVKDNGSISSFNINFTPWLKEFMLANPPSFKISAKCCQYAKKEPGKKHLNENDFDLNCVGIRKAEGGVRSNRYKTCFSHNDCGADNYRPLFWFSDKDKAEYEAHYDISHSDCYKVWGMDRTGCAGCPFGKNYEKEIALVEKYEPKFHRAIMKLFGESYEYTRKFMAFREEMKGRSRQ